MMTAPASMASASAAVTTAARLDFPLRHRLSQKPILRYPEHRLSARHIGSCRSRLFPLFGTPVYGAENNSRNDYCLLYTSDAADDNGSV